MQCARLVDGLSPKERSGSVPSFFFGLALPILPFDALAPILKSLAAAQFPILLAYLNSRHVVSP